MDRLIKLIDEKEAMEEEKRKKIQEQQMELEKGLARLYSTRTPIETRPRKKIRQVRRLKQREPNSEMKARELQVKAAWHSKIEHIITKRDVNDEMNSKEVEPCQHMFTYPFRTVDNSLHQSCNGLVEFSHHSGISDVHDTVYEKGCMTPSIVISNKSVGSLRPGCEMDDNIVNFCLSW